MGFLFSLLVPLELSLDLCVLFGFSPLLLFSIFTDLLECLLALDVFPAFELRENDIKIIILVKRQER